VVATVATRVAGAWAEVARVVAGGVAEKVGAKAAEVEGGVVVAVQVAAGMGAAATAEVRVAAKAVA
jgi:hypothetical protein